MSFIGLTRGKKWIAKKSLHLDLLKTKRIGDERKWIGGMPQKKRELIPICFVFWSERRTVNGITWNKKMQILKIPTPKRCWRGFGCSNLRRTIFIVGCCRFEAPGAICFIVEMCWTHKQKKICYIFITFSQKFLY